MKTTKMRRHWFGFGIIGLSIFALVILCVMALWNGLIPTIFGITKITFWQAAGLIILSKLLFGCFRCGRWGHHRFPYHWRKENQLHEKWMTMSPEERKEYIHKRMSYMKYHRWDFDDCYHDSDKSNINEEPKKEDDSK